MQPPRLYPTARVTHAYVLHLPCMGAAAVQRTCAPEHQRPGRHCSCPAVEAGPNGSLGAHHETAPLHVLNSLVVGGLISASRQALHTTSAERDDSLPQKPAERV